MRHTQDNRLAVAMGCAVEHAVRIGYAEGFTVSAARMTQVGINCRTCPRQGCEARAHQTVILSAPADEKRRGATRYDSPADQGNSQRTSHEEADSNRPLRFRQDALQTYRRRPSFSIST